jgi:hypothetical protein
LLFLLTREANEIVLKYSMESYKFIDENPFNSGESVIGNVIIYKNNIIIPFYDIYIYQKYNEAFPIPHFNYIKFSYLVLKRVSRVSFNHEQSKDFKENRSCYGGEHYKDNSHLEFWVEYKESNIFLPENYEYSKDPFIFNRDQTYLFENQNEIASILETLGNL